MVAGELVLPGPLFGLDGRRTGVLTWPPYGVGAAAGCVDGSAETYRTTGVGRAAVGGSGVVVPGAVRRCTTGLSLRPAVPATATGRPSAGSARDGEV
ncbi:hypothetical protein [Streptomyces sp. NPDC006333]|uniref:hypothetical protein n=1 Tax=Streptomyces sp. NPDC006333 TaxID=3156753 RepID=UPI0033B0D1A9